MKVLGIDQSYTSCALVLIQDGEVIQTEKISSNKDWDRFDQAADIAAKVSRFVKPWGEQIDKIGIEGLAFGGKGNVTRDLAGLQFCIVNKLRETGHRKNIKIISIKTVKVFACGKGHGNAKKEELFEALPNHVKRDFMEKKFKKTTGLFDMTDAYWIARYREEND